MDGFFEAVEAGDAAAVTLFLSEHPDAAKYCSSPVNGEPPPGNHRSKR